MNWTGKFFGFLIGFILLSPLGLGFIGGIIGAIIGSRIDQRRVFLTNPRIQVATSHVFLDITFAVMGHIAKSDGHISQDEIRAARQVMDKIGLNEAQRQRAIEQFNRGKQPTFNLDLALQQLIQTCHHQRNLLRMFVEVQIQAAYANGIVRPNEQRILQYICHQLGMGNLNFQLLNMLYGRGQSGFHQQYQSSGQQQYQRTYATQNTLEKSYAILGISATATDVEAKRAYRKLMSLHHPDKLMSKGLPPEMMKLATEKAQQIQKAYETVCKARAM